MSKRIGLTQMFLDFAKPDPKTGWSSVIRIDALNAHYKTNAFSTENGCSWGRSDSPLLRQYNVERIKGIAPSTTGGSAKKVIAVQLKGFKESITNQGIREDIRQALKTQKCVVLQTASEVHVDHKSPRQDTTPHVLDLETQTLSDFQALCRAANTAKRGHCRACIDSGTRFDAKILGYSVSQWLGPTKFSGSCVGCYWYDPVEFNAQVSKDFKPRPLSKKG